MPATTYVGDRLLELLTACQAGLTLLRSGNAIPSRNLRTHGPPAVDLCVDDGLLAVYLDSPAVLFDRPSVRDARGVGQRHYEPVLRMVVELWRCVKGLDDSGHVTVADLDQDASDLADDMWALVTYLGARLDSTFPTGLGGKVVMTLGDPVPLPPRGGVAGWRLSIQVPVSDGGP